jgi:formylglycine-generating enzyme required for sulfatase activity
MRRAIFALTLLLLLLSACGPTPDVSALDPPYIDTGIDPDAWATVPAGEFPYGQHDDITMVDYDYEIMVTDVTVAQYAGYLNEALADSDVYIGEFEVKIEDFVQKDTGVGGYYPGEPFHGYEHEFPVSSGDYIHVPFADGLRMTRDGEAFTPIEAYDNHPMTMVSWFGADAYCKHYGWRLPTEIEWEKAARGTEMVSGYGLPFPWGTEIHPNNANYYSSFDLFEKLFGKLGNTTPVGFYNGKSYTFAETSYQTRESASPYGLYDMAGNVWQWMGDDYPDQHYRYMRGGSFYSYEVDLRVWKNNSAGPWYYSPQVGFRCVRDR